MSAEKDLLRKAARARRAAAHGSADPGPAYDHLTALLGDTEGPVSFYWPIRTEIDPRPVMEAFAARREICLPVTHGRGVALSFRRWTPGTAMETDGFGVSVPARDDPVTPSVLVVPMLAFDDHGHRLSSIELPALQLRGRASPVEIFCIPAEQRVDFRPAA